MNSNDSRDHSSARPDPDHADRQDRQGPGRASRAKPGGAAEVGSSPGRKSHGTGNSAGQSGVSGSSTPAGSTIGASGGSGTLGNSVNSGTSDAASSDRSDPGNASTKK